MNNYHPSDLLKKSNDELQNLLYELSEEVIRNDAIQHRAIIRGMIINQVLLLRFSEKQEKRNSKIQYLSIIVALVALLVTIFK